MEFTLHNDFCTAKISDIGAELTSLVAKQREYIWTGDPVYWNGHNPILFPIIGFLKDGKTHFNGKEYEIPKHGYARKSSFTVVSQCDDSITLEMTENETTLTGFPFAFSFKVTHKLNSNGFTSAFQIENRSECEMPFMLGGHTGFCLPFTEGNSFSDHMLIFEHEEHNCTLLEAVGGQLIEDPIGTSNFLHDSDRIQLDYSLFDKDALILKDLTSKKVILCDANGKGVEMDYNGFDLLGIWTPPGKKAPFLCIEPWNGVNAFLNEAPEFSQKPYVIKLAPGEIYSADFTVRIL